MREMDDRLLRGLEPTAPPPELRETTLRAAHRTMARPETPDPWMRLWQSGSARLAWAAAAAVLLIGHAWVGSGPSSAQQPAMPVLALNASHDAELAETVGLPRVSSRAAAWIHRSEDITANDDGVRSLSSTTGGLS